MAKGQIGADGIGITFLDGSGNGTAKVGPLSAREVWHPKNAHFSVSTNANEATCTIYAGEDTSQKNFRDSSFSGSSGDVTDKIGSRILESGQHIFAVWVGGDAGSQAILRVTGTKDI